MPNNMSPSSGKYYNSTDQVVYPIDGYCQIRQGFKTVCNLNDLSIPRGIEMGNFGTGAIAGINNITSYEIRPETLRDAAGLQGNWVYILKELNITAKANTPEFGTNRVARIDGIKSIPEKYLVNPEQPTVIYDRQYSSFDALASLGKTYTRTKEVEKILGTTYDLFRWSYQFYGDTCGLELYEGNYFKVSTWNIEDPENPVEASIDIPFVTVGYNGFLLPVE